MNHSNNLTIEPQHFESLYPANTREQEIEKILQYVKQGNSCQVIALPGVGRSTLLGLLAYNKTVRQHHLKEQEKQYHFVLTNFSEVRRRDLLDVTKFIFLSLVDSLRDRQFTEEYEKTKTIFQEALSLNDELVLFQGLKQAIDILAAEKNLTIVFLFDRFEEYIPMLTPEFFANLRVLRNRAKYQFSVVFSLNRPLEDSIEPAMMTEYYDFVVGHNVYLPIVDEVGTKHRIKALEEMSGKKVDKEILDAVIDVTGGFTREIKVCVQTILGIDVNQLSGLGIQFSDNSFSVISQSDKQKTGKLVSDNRHLRTDNRTINPLAHFLLSHKTVQRPLFEMWQALTPSEQDFILSGDYQTTDSDYQYLSRVGLLNDGKLTIPLFEKFLHTFLAQQRQSVTQNQSIQYDANTNEIKQGDVILSDSLTSSEFRLLRYLIQNPDRVIEREELINAVWKDNATTAGVTDQALDQLIFRVRRKIEEDPNNPSHLQTVKGRGIRFIAQKSST
jgi:DNA-binding winged helix-turn-helix (wHTH) protein